MQRFIRAAAIVFALVMSSSLFGALTAPAAQALPKSDCHGYVYSFYKSGNTIHMKYWIYCSKRHTQIGVTPLLREADRFSRRNTVTCKNAYVCQNEELLADRPGSQVYSAYAVDGVAPPKNYVLYDAHHGWICHTTMDCTGAAKKF